jgi:hypothetical protein
MPNPVECQKLHSTLIGMLSNCASNRLKFRLTPKPNLERVNESWILDVLRLLMCCSTVNQDHIDDSREDILEKAGRLNCHISGVSLNMTNRIVFKLCVESEFHTFLGVSITQPKLQSMSRINANCPALLQLSSESVRHVVRSMTTKTRTGEA